MKTLSIIALSLIISMGATSQTYITQVKSVDSKLWGYINQNNEAIALPKYKKCYPFAENGIAAINKSGTFSFINTSGKDIPTEISGFELQKGFIGFGGLQGFYDGMAAVMKDKKWGFLNSEGKVAIELKYERVSIFNSGFATAQSGNQFFVINKSGDETEIENADIFEVKRFAEGLAPFTNNSKESGFINTSGEVVVAANFLTVGYFKNGLAWAKDGEKKVGFIDKTGEWAIPPQFDAAKQFDPESGLARIKTDGVWSYVNKKGEIISIQDTESWGDFSEGLAKGKKDGKTGYFNNKGEWVIAPQFDGGRDFKNGYAAVKKGKLWGFIDQTGKWVIEAQYASAKDMEKID